MDMYGHRAVTFPSKSTQLMSKPSCGFQSNKMRTSVWMPTKHEAQEDAEATGLQEDAEADRRRKSEKSKRIEDLQEERRRAQPRKPTELNQQTLGRGGPLLPEATGGSGAMCGRNYPP